MLTWSLATSMPSTPRALTIHSTMGSPRAGRREGEPMMAAGVEGTQELSDTSRIRSRQLYGSCHTTGVGSHSSLHIHPGRIAERVEWPDSCAGTGGWRRPYLCSYMRWDSHSWEKLAEAMRATMYHPSTSRATPARTTWTYTTLVRHRTTTACIVQPLHGTLSPRCGLSS